MTQNLLIMKEEKKEIYMITIVVKFLKRKKIMINMKILMNLV